MIASPSFALLALFQLSNVLAASSAVVVDLSFLNTIGNAIKPDNTTYSSPVVAYLRE